MIENSYRIALWILLNCIVIIFMDLAMFTQTTPQMKNASYLQRLLVSEYYATLEWLFLIPMNLLGNTFLNAIQLVVVSFVFMFIGQIISNRYWLNKPTTIDDYVAMYIMLIGIVVSFYRYYG